MTDTNIGNLPAAKQRENIPDFGRGSVRGLELRCAPGVGGSKVWNIRFRSPVELASNGHGAQRRMKLGNWPAISVADARQSALAVLGEVAKGNDPSMTVEASGRVESFGDVLDLYIMSHVVKLKETTQKEVTRQIDVYVRPILGRIAVNKVTPALLARTWRDIDKAGKLTLAKRVHSLMSKMGKVAFEAGWLTENPMVGLSYTFKPVKRDRFLSEAEIRTFWQKLDDMPLDRLTRCALRLMIVTGQRTSEILGARISEIDFTKKLWTLPAARMKKGQRHVVPISDMAVALFKQAIDLSANRRGETDLIFPAAKRIGPNKLSGSVIVPIDHQVTARAIARNFETMGLEKFTGHDLRRTYATHLAESGVSFAVVETLLAHRSGSRGGLVATYNHAGLEEQMKAAVKVWQDRLQRIIGANVVAMRQA